MIYITYTLKKIKIKATCKAFGILGGPCGNQAS